MNDAFRIQRGSALPRAGRIRVARAPGRAGVGLLELLVVVTVLAIAAAGALHFAAGRQDSLRRELAFVELVRLRAALLAFQEDTGHLPRQGPFALVSDPAPGRVALPPEGPLWFHHPFNVSQLLEQPRDPAGEPVLSFSIDTGRGWRGPYLRHGTEGLVSPGAALQHDGAGDPTLGSLLDPMPAVADPFDHHRPVLVGEDEYLGWTREVGGQPLVLGRPIALVELDDSAAARLIGFGSNGIYEGGAGDDLVLYLR